MKQVFRPGNFVMAMAERIRFADLLDIHRLQFLIANFRRITGITFTVFTQPVFFDVFQTF